MKKRLFLAVACMLTLGIHAHKLITETSDGITVQKSEKAAHYQKHSTTSHRTLAENQYFCGYYTSDALAQYGSGMGSYTSGVCKAATEFTPDIYKNFEGFKVIGMRVGLCANISDFDVFISKVKSSTIEEFKSHTVGNGLTGWNTIMFEEDEQFVLPSDNTSFIVGFSYYQKRGNTEDCYPISYYEQSDKKGTFLFYGNISSTYGGSGLAWYNLGQDGALSVQLIVEGELPEQHLIIGSGNVNKNFYQQGEEVTWIIPATNMGNTEITSLGFDIMLDDTKLCDIISDTSIQSGKDKNIEATVSLPTDISVGSHTLKAILTTINGEAPVSEVENAIQTANITTYITTVQRQKMLIEHITSWTCTYCYLGYQLLRQMEQQYDDIAWVAIHGNQSSNKDPYYFATVDNIMNMLGANSFPCAAFNRTFLPDLAEEANQIAYGIGYYQQYISQLVPMIHEMMVENAVPSFVSLDIEHSYDSKNRILNITVKGTGVEKASELLADNKVTIYLTEEGLKGRQYSNGKWDSTFDHNNTLRAVLTNYQGDAIAWNGDNFEITKTYTIPESYIADNLSITAFIAPKVGKKQNMAVNNCERVKVNTNTSGINNIDNTTSIQNAIHYTLDGRRVQTMQKGINIVRMANGKTIKIIQK